MIDAFSSCLAVWLACLVFDPFPPGDNFWGFTWYEAAGWIVLAGTLAGAWRETVRSRAFWFGVAIVAWFAWRTPMADVDKTRCLALAVAVGMATRFMPSRASGRLPTMFLWAGLAVLALSAADGLFGRDIGLLRRWQPDSVTWAGLVRGSGFFTHPNLFAFFIVVSLWAALNARWPRGWIGWAVAVVFGLLVGWRLFETFSRIGAALFALACLAGGYRLWRIWSAPAERSGDGALPWDGLAAVARSQSAVAASLCRRAPHDCRFAPYVMIASSLLAFTLCVGLTWNKTAARFFEPDTVNEFGGQSEGAAFVSGRASVAPPQPFNRGDIYREAWQIWMRRPWTGWGLGAYFRLGHANHHHSHNLLLEAGISGGVVGVLLIMIPLIFALVKGRGVFARGIVAFSLLAGILDCYFVYKWPAVILALCVGLATRDE